MTGSRCWRAGTGWRQPRQRSLAAAVEWSYRLLDEEEQRVFRAVSVFPGPFTLEGAEAVAGPGAGPAVLRLVDCSLLVPPRAGPDGRTRYAMLETLRAYGAGLLAEAGEEDAAAAALAGYALRVAEAAAAGLQTAHRGGGRLRLAGRRGRHHAPGAGLGDGARPRPWRCGWRSRWRQWWQLRGRLTGQAPLLRRGRRHAEAGQRRVVRRAASGSARRQPVRPIRPARWRISPRSATPSRTPSGRGRARCCWRSAWPAGRRHCSRWAGWPRRPTTPAARWPWPARAGFPGRRGARPDRASAPPPAGRRPGRGGPARPRRPGMSRATPRRAAPGVQQFWR